MMLVIVGKVNKKFSSLETRAKNCQQKLHHPVVEAKEEKWKAIRGSRGK